MKSSLMLIPFLVLLSCNRHSCPDRSVQQDFKKQLRTVEKFQKGKSTLVKDYRHAIIYLGLISDTGSRADYSSTVGFRSEEDNIHDMTVWKKWYSESKCKLTAHYVDSVMRHYKVRPE